MDLTRGISWFRGSSVRIRRDGTEIHIDPSGITEGDPADYVLLTHRHCDNFSEENIARVRGPGTTVIAPASMKKQLADADHFLRPCDMLQLEGVDVLAVPAYTPEKKFHPLENGWLGYVFTLDRVTYYHAGDTGLLGLDGHDPVRRGVPSVRQPLHDGLRRGRAGSSGVAAQPCWCQCTRGVVGHERGHRNG